MATYCENTSNQNDVMPGIVSKDSLQECQEAECLPISMMMYLDQASSAASYAESASGNYQLQPNCDEPPSTGTPSHSMPFSQGNLSDLICSQISETPYDLWREGENEISFMQRMSESIGKQIDGINELTCGSVNEDTQIGVSVSTQMENFRSGQNLQEQGLSLSINTQIPNVAMPLFGNRSANLVQSSFMSSYPSTSGAAASGTDSCHDDDIAQCGQSGNVGYFPPHNVIKREIGQNYMHLNRLTGLSSIVSTSKYHKVAQQLLDEVVDVRKSMKPETNRQQNFSFSSKVSKDNNEKAAKDSTLQNSEGSKTDLEGELSPANSQDLQNKITELLSMLDKGSYSEMSSRPMKLKRGQLVMVKKGNLKLSTRWSGKRKKKVRNNSNAHILDWTRGTLCLAVYLEHLQVIIFGGESRLSTEEKPPKPNRSSIPTTSKPMKKSIKIRKKTPISKTKYIVQSDFFRKFKVFLDFFILAAGTVIFFRKVFGIVAKKVHELDNPTLEMFCELVKESITEVKTDAELKGYERSSFIIGSTVIADDSFRDTKFMYINSKGECEWLTYAAIGCGKKYIKQWLKEEKWKDTKSVDEAIGLFIDAISRAIGKIETCGGSVEIIVLKVKDHKLEEKGLFNISENLSLEFNKIPRAPKQPYIADVHTILTTREFVHDDGECYEVKVGSPFFSGPYFPGKPYNPKFN